LRSVNHLSEATLAAAVEGTLTPWERRRVLRHLAACPQCAAEWAALHRLLREANLLPPMPLRHPLEQALDWLGLIAPLPVWVWHALLFALTPLLWIALVDVASVPYLSVRRTLEVWPAALLMTTHFIWLQSRLRQSMGGLWEAGVPADEVDAFQRRYLWVFQGRRLGGGWFFFGLALVATVINWLLMPAPPFWEGLKVAVIGFYALMVTAAMYWGWLWGGRLWWGGLERRSRGAEVQGSGGGHLCTPAPQLPCSGGGGGGWEHGLALCRGSRCARNTNGDPGVGGSDFPGAPGVVGRLRRIGIAPDATPG